MHRAPAVLLLALGSLPRAAWTAWDCQGQDGSGYGVFARSDNHFVPVELMTVGVE